MSALTIGQVAERTGFSASSLRYYEGIGLVAPTGRTDAGYRLYDETTVERLAFIARAKQLGCTLEEITDLVSIWDRDECGPVQRRFHALITTKIAETQQRLAELTRFAEQLRRAATQLSTDPADGPCADGCACLGPPDDGLDEIPIACSLDADEVADREAEWASLLAHVTDRTTTADGALRLALDAATPLDGLVRLVAAEQACCAFFAFSVRIDADGIALEVRAPGGAETVVEALFGTPGPAPVAQLTPV